ncbi:MAG: methyltransferase domain-containing protein [Leptolyngbyaceae bacterium]|nr:methyltransferase domain-containing protein [Leptolyngbyaceae bacterium]
MPNCSICDSPSSRVLSMGMQPLANKYPSCTDDFEHEVVREMEVFFCDQCNYANIPCDIDRSTFFEDYYYLSSVNKELVAHFEEVAMLIEKHNPKLTIDIGSNDGILLKPLKEKGLRAIGVDPSENVSAIANAAGLETLVGFYDLAMVERILKDYGQPDFLCASSVFTHFERPRDFFEVSAQLLSEDGLILVEVEYLRQIIDTLGFERLYFDRPHYYSIKSLKTIAERSGFSLIDVVNVDAHGGSIRATFCRKGSKKASPSVERKISEESTYLNRSTILEKFELFKSACEELAQKIDQFNANGIKLAAYGCPARFSTITNVASIGPNRIPFVIDDSPLKQGRFSPKMHIPIVSSDSIGHIDLFIVFAYEYINSIKSKLDLNQAEFYKPIPFSKI